MVRIKPVKIVKRGKNYQLYYFNPRGERRRLSVGSDWQQAQRMAVKFNDWLVEGKDPETEMSMLRQAELARNVSIRDFFPVFMERHGSLQSAKMQQLYHVCFSNICRCKELADLPLARITKRLMLDYMLARMKQDGVTPATVNREASFVKGMLSRATEWDIIVTNPLGGLRMLREAEKRIVDMTPEQASDLLADLPERTANIVEFAIYSGFRKENILGLRIESLRFHDITRTGEAELVVKGGRTEKFPLGPYAVEVLKKAMGSRKEGYVFVNPRTGTRYRSVHKAFDRAVRKLGLDVNGTKLRFHDLRHVFATWLYRRGITLDTVRELLGHRNRSTTDRYATLDRMAAGQHLINLPRIEIKARRNKAAI